MGIDGERDSRGHGNGLEFGLLTWTGKANQSTARLGSRGWPIILVLAILACARTIQNFIPRRLLTIPTTLQKLSRALSPVTATHHTLGNNWSHPLHQFDMVQKPMRLPPLRVLRVRNPNKEAPNPCLPIMSSVLGE